MTSKDIEITCYIETPKNKTGVQTTKIKLLENSKQPFNYKWVLHSINKKILTACPG